MRSDAKKVFYFHADASALGGFIEKPFSKIVPSQASVSLPAVGGHDTSRADAFNFEEIVSFRSAYTRVSGGGDQKDGPWSTLVTSVVEGLNLLEVVKAERIVAQVTITHPANGGFPIISLTGSHFDRLQIGGRDAVVTLNPTLLEGWSEAGAPRKPITWPLLQETGRQQAAKLVKGVKSDGGDPFRWLIERYGWMASDRKQGTDGFALCSLVDGIGRAIPGRSFGHVLEIPDFGRIFFAEVLASPVSLQLSMIRAELGCGVNGQVEVAAARGIGHSVPP
jgi:hypothetical protein